MLITNHHMKKLLPGLSGYAIVHNAIEGDYCVQEAITSLLPVCDEVVVADCESNDGTLDALNARASQEPKLRVVKAPWPKVATYDQWKTDAKDRPINDNWFWPKLINVVRPHLRHAQQIHLDADEVLFPCAREEVQKCVFQNGCRYFRRLNFWRDPQTLVPDGWVCGTNVARQGPTELWMPSDECHPEGEPEMRVRAVKHPDLLIGHYGFLRTQPGFFAKSKMMQLAVHGTYDARLEEAERTGRPWHELGTFPAELVPYSGQHPDFMIPWLRNRNHRIP